MIYYVQVYVVNYIYFKFECHFVVPMLYTL